VLSNKMTFDLVFRTVVQLYRSSVVKVIGQSSRL